MSRLLRDRYFAFTADTGWDLATGETVPLHDRPDDQVPSQPPLAALVEVLDHGRDGTPRRVVIERPPGSRMSAVIRRAAEDARARGFVPIAVDVYLRCRARLAQEIGERSLLLIARPGIDAGMARAALQHAAASTPRPHVLITFEPAPAELPAQPHLVREARPLYAAQPLRSRPAAPLPDDVRRQIARGSRSADLARAGRHAASERLLRDVAAALVRRQASAPAAETFISLGRLLLERGRAKDADDAFAAAAAHGEAGEPATLTDARLWQAAARTDAAQLTGAESICRAVLLTSSLTPADRARAEAALARVLVWQDRIDEASELPLSSVPGHGGVPAAYVGATAVRVLLAARKTFEAGQRARATVQAAEACGDPLARVVAASAHLRVLLEVGDLVLAEDRLLELRRLTREARTPLRLVRARLLWAEALTRAGRSRDAGAENDYLRRIQPAAPPLLGRAIARHLQAERAVRSSASAAPPVTAAASLIAIVQREDDDRTALLRLLESVASGLRCSRVDLWSADGGPATAIVSSGTGVPTTLGVRVLEAGIVLGPDAGDPGRETGVPVRLGSRLVAALVARWAADQTPPAHARSVLELAAAVAAPRADGLLVSARETVRAATAIPDLVGTSAAMAELRRSVARAASAPFAVLIEGESGVGKELVARAIHQLSPRRQRRFCDVNCAALPDDLIESELFGHARGAFTGAVAERAGLVEDADGGTLFLDEVADLSPRAQAKLLRVVQQQEVRRVGESFSRKVDVRVVSAANRDMRVEAGEGRFRQDLLYRLEVIRIRIPPLRERPEDVALLAAHFWREAAARVGTTAMLSHAVLTALTRYHWPGNVRELQNVMSALAVAAPSRGHVRPALLPAIITGAAAITSPRLRDARVQFERRFLEVALARAGGSRSRAARELGVSRQGLLKLLARLGLESG